MESAYVAIGAWLEHPDSPLAIYRPLIYPQGSAGIGDGSRLYPAPDLGHLGAPPHPRWRRDSSDTYTEKTKGARGR